MARIAERVPGFGGVYLDTNQNVVYIYLQDPRMQETAETVLTEVLGPDFLVGKEVDVLEGEYRMAHLEEWFYRTMIVLGGYVPGLVGTSVNERTKRITLRVQPRRGGREQIEAAIATAEVPREAFVIRIGCNVLRLGDYMGEKPGKAFLRAIHHSLEMVSQAPYGETVRMKMTVRNVSDGPVRFYTGGRPPHDFVIMTPDGEPVWRWACAKIRQLPLDSEILEPGEMLEFTGEWEQVGNRGEPVPPGTYLVQGILNLGPREKLVTSAHELEVFR